MVDPNDPAKRPLLDALARSMAKSSSYALRCYAALVLERLEGQGYAIYAKRSPKERRPATSVKMSRSIAIKMRRVWKRNPGITQAEIARQFRVNPGRVSEAVNNKR